MVSSCYHGYHRLYDCPTVYVISYMRKWLIFKFHVCLDVINNKTTALGGREMVTGLVGFNMNHEVIFDYFILQVQTLKFVLTCH